MENQYNEQNDKNIKQIEKVLKYADEQEQIFKDNPNPDNYNHDYKNFKYEKYSKAYKNIKPGPNEPYNKYYNEINNLYRYNRSRIIRLRKMDQDDDNLPSTGMYNDIKNKLTLLISSKPIKGNVSLIPDKTKTTSINAKLFDQTSDSLEILADLNRLIKEYMPKSREEFTQNDNKHIQEKLNNVDKTTGGKYDSYISTLMLYFNDKADVKQIAVTKTKPSPQMNEFTNNLEEFTKNPENAEKTDSKAFKMFKIGDLGILTGLNSLINKYKNKSEESFTETEHNEVIQELDKVDVNTKNSYSSYISDIKKYFTDKFTERSYNTQHTENEKHVNEFSNDLSNFVEDPENNKSSNKFKMRDLGILTGLSSILAKYKSRSANSYTKMEHDEVMSEIEKVNQSTNNSYSKYTTRISDYFKNMLNRKQKTPSPPPSNQEVLELTNQMDEFIKNPMLENADGIVNIDDIQLDMDDESNASSNEFDSADIIELRKLNDIVKTQSEMEPRDYNEKILHIKDYNKIIKKTKGRNFDFINKIYKFLRAQIYSKMNFPNRDTNIPTQEEYDTIIAKLDDVLIQNPEEDKEPEDHSNQEVFNEYCEQQSDKTLIGVIDGDCIYSDSKKRLSKKEINPDRDETDETDETDELNVDTENNEVQSDDVNNNEETNQMTGGKYYFSNKTPPGIKIKDSDISHEQDTDDFFNDVVNINYNLPVFKTMNNKQRETVDLLENCISDSKYELMGVIGDKSALTCILFNKSDNKIEPFDLDDDNLIEIARKNAIVNNT